MSNTEAKIVFTPSGKRGTFALGTRVLDAARSLGIAVDSVCGGRAMCGRCQVNVAEGQFATLTWQHSEIDLADLGEGIHRETPLFRIARFDQVEKAGQEAPRTAIGRSGEARYAHFVAP